MFMFCDAGFIDEHYEFPGQMWAYLSDGIGIMTGSMMGTSPLTVFLESAAGIEDGGRTGVTGARRAELGVTACILVTEAEFYAVAWPLQPSWWPSSSSSPSSSAPSLQASLHMPRGLRSCLSVRQSGSSALGWSGCSARVVQAAS